MPTTQIQENRKAAGNQVRALAESEEPHGVIQWLFDQNDTVEKQIKRALDSWTDAIPAARWAKSIVGIGPVISAGLAAHIDVTRADHGRAHLAVRRPRPHRRVEEGREAPLERGLKTLCWKIGESFVKVSGHEDDFYGQAVRPAEGVRDSRATTPARWPTRPRANWSGSTSARRRTRTRRTPPGSSRPPTSTPARSVGR